LTSPARRQQIERIAQQLVTQLRAARQARFTTSDETFQRDVIIRVNQILSGDDYPTEVLADG
jgi:chorismate-pyruvate lyase